MSREYHDMLLARRTAATLNLVDEAYRNIMALSDDGKRALAARLDAHYSKVHPDGPKWGLVDTRAKP